MLDDDHGFEWDFFKEQYNIEKHGVDFKTAMLVFKDPNLVVLMDRAHSIQEERFWGMGLANGHIMTVRFVYRGAKIRILGAGYWRKGAQYYEKKKI